MVDWDVKNQLKQTMHVHLANKENGPINWKIHGNSNQIGIFKQVVAMLR